MCLGRGSSAWADVARWAELRWGKDRGNGISIDFLKLMTFYPEFRNLFYFRIGPTWIFFNLMCRRLSSLHLHATEIGPGLFIEHGFSTIVAARKIGKNCWINQQVTVGYSNAVDCPEIGDNVVISAGAKIIGDVLVGHNSRIGANAVVVKNVPPNCTVVGVPARIVRINGEKVQETEEVVPI